MAPAHLWVEKQSSSLAVPCGAEKPFLRLLGGACSPHSRPSGMMQSVPSGPLPFAHIVSLLERVRAQSCSQPQLSDEGSRVF